MNALIISDKWIEQIAKSQGIQWDRTTRIIIDATCGEPVRMYITQLGDDRVLDLQPPEVLPPEITQAASKQDGEASKAAKGTGAS